jgi:hypothetical protein
MLLRIDVEPTSARHAGGEDVPDAYNTDAAVGVASRLIALVPFPYSKLYAAIVVSPVPPLPTLKTPVVFPSPMLLRTVA